MANGRIKRDDPARTRPNRTVTGNSGQAEGGAHHAGPTGAAPPPRKHPNKVIGDAVNVAYRIADQHIQQGRQAAARVREGSYSSADLDHDLRALFDRTLLLSKELGVASVDLFDGLLRTGFSQRSVGPTGPGPGAQEVTVEVRPTRPVQVLVDFSPKSESFVPRVLPLHAAARNIPPLTSVRFEFKDRARPTLVVEVPEDQPAGAYAGSIVDEHTHEPGGSVSVRVLKE